MSANEATPARLKFHYVTAAYGCPRCLRTCSRHGPTLGGYYAAAALLASLPIDFVLLRPPWSLPWTSFAGIIAGELLLLFASGFVAGMFCGVAPPVCRDCKAWMSLRGRYFSDSRRPRSSDLAILSIFTAINISALIYLYRCTNALVK